MMKPKGILFLLSVILLTACSDVTREWKAATAAQKYYEQLAKGDTGLFLQGKAGVNSLPAGYRQQLLKAIQQYQTDMQQKHGGLHGVRISDNLPEADTLLGQPFVKTFLVLCYNDSTEEEIVVPMVEENEDWRMK